LAKNNPNSSPLETISVEATNGGQFSSFDFITWPDNTNQVLFKTNKDIPYVSYVLKDFSVGAPTGGNEVVWSIKQEGLNFPFIKIVFSTPFSSLDPEKIQTEFIERLDHGQAKELTISNPYSGEKTVFRLQGSPNILDSLIEDLTKTFSPAQAEAAELVKTPTALPPATATQEPPATATPEPIATVNSKLEIKPSSLTEDQTSLAFIEPFNGRVFQEQKSGLPIVLSNELEEKLLNQIPEEERSRLTEAEINLKLSELINQNHPLNYFLDYKQAKKDVVRPYPGDVLILTENGFWYFRGYYEGAYFNKYKDKTHLPKFHTFDKNGKPRVIEVPEELQNLQQQPLNDITIKWEDNEQTVVVFDKKHNLVLYEYNPSSDSWEQVNIQPTPTAEEKKQFMVNTLRAESGLKFEGYRIVDGDFMVLTGGKNGFSQSETNLIAEYFKWLRETNPKAFQMFYSIRAKTDGICISKDPVQNTIFRIHSENRNIACVTIVNNPFYYKYKGVIAPKAHFLEVVAHELQHINQSYYKGWEYKEGDHYCVKGEYEFHPSVEVDAMWFQRKFLDSIEKSLTSEERRVAEFSYQNVMKAYGKYINACGYNP